MVYKDAIMLFWQGDNNPASERRKLLKHSLKNFIQISIFKEILCRRMQKKPCLMLLGCCSRAKPAPGGEMFESAFNWTITRRCNKKSQRPFLRGCYATCPEGTCDWLALLQLFGSRHVTPMLRPPFCYLLYDRVELTREWGLAMEIWLAFRIVLVLRNKNNKF